MGAAAPLDSHALEAAGLVEWRERLRSLLDDLADAIEAPAQLALQRLEAAIAPLAEDAQRALERYRTDFRPDSMPPSVDRSSTGETDGGSPARPREDIGEPR